MTKVQLDIPTAKCCIHFPGIDDWPILDLVFVPFIGMEFMTVDGYLYVVHRVIHNLYTGLVDVYVRPFESKVIIGELQAVNEQLLEALEKAIRMLDRISLKVNDPEIIASICLIREMELEPAVAKAKGEADNG